jgi:signal transduction histidine kinase
MDKYIRIIISDKGVGIPSDELNNIYLPFKRASNARFIGGYGIGLSLVSKILELHDVDLKVYSTVNEGTRFEMLFKRTE